MHSRNREYWQMRHWVEWDRDGIKNWCVFTADKDDKPRLVASHHETADDAWEHARQFDRPEDSRKNAVTAQPAIGARS
jgi:hypothetical protein